MLNCNELQLKNKDELISLVSDIQDETTAQKNELTASKKIIDQLKEYILLLKHERYCSLSEKYTDNNPQGRLFDEAQLSENEAEIESTEEELIIPEHKRTKSGRKSLDKDLPRKQIIHDLSDEEKQCACGCQLTCIGDETTEQLDIVPAKIYVLQHVCKKYACKQCEDTIKTAKKPIQPIPKSIAAPGLLAHVLTSKFQYHLPLYRQEKMLNALGTPIARNTLSLWVIKCGQLLQPLVNLLQDEILNYDIAYADETTLQVLKESDKSAQSKSYMWAFGGGPPERFCYLYQYHSSRAHQVAIDFFSEFAGYIHCDGYQSYDNLAAKNASITQAACWYHARRKFNDASKVSKKPGMADWFLKQIGRLARIEKIIKESQLDAAQTYAYRNEHAPDIINKIKNKLHELRYKTPPEGLLGKAIHYTLNQWLKLQVYLEDGRLEISNNRMERAIKPFAVGRKNWLFANSVDGAKAAANIFSLIETCKAHDINVYDWLRDALTKLPACETVAEYEALMPFNFEKSEV